MEEENEKYGKKIKDEVEKLTEQLIENGIQPDNICFLSQLVDIHKDLENEEYWKIKEENYMYRDYNDYGRRARDSRGRYMEGSYGRRGVKGTGRGRYRGHDMLDNMYETYSDYAENNEYGNYGGSENMELIEAMADSLMGFIEHLKSTAKTPEERHLIDKKLKELSDM